MSAREIVSAASSGAWHAMNPSAVELLCCVNRFAFQQTVMQSENANIQQLEANQQKSQEEAQTLLQLR